MHRPELEKQRRERDRSSSGVDDRGGALTARDGTPLGVLAVALLVGLAGLADLAAALGLTGVSLLVFAPIVGTLGVVKLWVAVGLARLRVRALGVAILLHVVDAMVGGLLVAFAWGPEGPAGGPVVRIVVDLVVVGYLLVAADAFE